MADSLSNPTIKNTPLAGAPGPSFRLASYQRYGATPGVIL